MFARFVQHWHTMQLELSNMNIEMRIEELEPFPATRKRKGRQRVLKPIEQDDEQVIHLGNMGRLGTDNLYEIVIRLDANSISSCLQVNRAMLAFITSPSFRRAWRGKNGVLLGSRTRPWRLLTQGESESSLYQPLNTPPRCPGEVVASAGGLLCINMHPTSDVLELVVGNPLTKEWVLLPTPEQEFPVSSRMSFRMEVLTGGHFKVACYERPEWMYRVFVYESGSDSWGVTELHYPWFSVSKWSDYDLARSCWRTSVISVLGLGVETRVKRHPDEYHQLSHPFDHGFCRWEYRSTAYFASLWVTHTERSLSGYGVWKVEESSGELVPVSARWCNSFTSHPDALHFNDECEMFISCNAFENLVCFMGESVVHPAMPVVTYDIDSDAWMAFEDKCVAPDQANSGGKAFEHLSVALVYSPSLLAPCVRYVFDKVEKIADPLGRNKNKRHQRSVQGLHKLKEKTHRHKHSPNDVRGYYSRQHRHPPRQEKTEHDHDHYSRRRRRHRYPSHQEEERRREDRHYTSWDHSSSGHRRWHEDGRDNRDDWSRRHNRARESKHREIEQRSSCSRHEEQRNGESSRAAAS